MKHTLAALFCASLLLSACVEPGTDPVANDECGAAGYQDLVGKPGVMLDGMRFSQDVRVIRHGMAMTMDYRADRLNFWLDRRDVIERVTCG
ncbi:I78 family peptidase inhibitor [Tabrizicola sp.]|uniref:I78 family peptidase inhibitor n=1 Tax=Tabrizicola sp. TaxID=2005166 RepID=UPI00260ABE18|nr:I78 family peptidase inhibitor [Tabrizicola sp.]MDM7932322.1 I78 family peptidase inhibitor [Tabrizicola sp.]